MNQQFSTYLRDIGLLNETASSSIMKSDDKSSNKSFNDSSFDLLMKYFNNLDEEQKKFMSYHIPSKFIVITTKMKKDKLKSIIVQNNLRKRLILLKYFLTWKICILLKANIDTNKIQTKLNLENIDNNEDHDNKESIKNEEEQKNKEIQTNRNSSNNEDDSKHLSNNKNIKNNNNSNISENNSNYKYINVYNNKNDSDMKSYYVSENKIKPNNKYTQKSNSAISRTLNQIINKENNSNFRSHLMTSLEEKEMLELEECCFRPRINKPKKRKNSNNSHKNKRQEIFEKLYRYNEKYKLAKELRAIELEKIAGQKITFIPSTNFLKKSNKKLIKKSFSQLSVNSQKKNLKNKRVKSEENLSFRERLNNYMIKKRKHSAEIKNNLDSIYNEICSFNPKINSEKSKSTYCTNKKEQKNKVKNNTVFSRLYKDGKERINSRTKKEQNNINKILEMANVINPEKNFDIKTINRLYENKEKKHNIRKIIKKVEEEEGTTFKPFISQNNNYSKSVNGTFYERNQKLINDRESFYEEENKKIVENEKKHFIGKDYTKEERQKVINNIINRLYNDSSFIKKPIKDSGYTIKK